VNPLAVALMVFVAFAWGFFEGALFTFSRDRNAKRHDREAGHGPKDESAISSNPNRNP